jgi:cell division protein FtsB
MLSNFLKNSSIKDIALLITAGLCIFLFINFMHTSGNNRKQIKELRKENKEIQNRRNILEIEILRLKSEESKYLLNIEKYGQKIDSLSHLIIIKDSEIESTKIKLRNSQKEMERTKHEIKKLKENPVKRTGNELLDSIKEKASK